MSVHDERGGNECCVCHVRIPYGSSTCSVCSLRYTEYYTQACRGCGQRIPLKGKSVCSLCKCYYCGSDDHPDNPCPQRAKDARRFQTIGFEMYPRRFVKIGKLNPKVGKIEWLDERIEFGNFDDKEIIDNAQRAKLAIKKLNED